MACAAGALETLEADVFFVYPTLLTDEAEFEEAALLPVAVVLTAPSADLTAKRPPMPKKTPAAITDDNTFCLVDVGREPAPVREFVFMTSTMLECHLHSIRLR